MTMGVRERVARSEALPLSEFVSVSNVMAIRAVELSGEFHSGPADRMIVATALATGGRLLTREDKILNYPHVMTLW